MKKPANSLRSLDHHPSIRQPFNEATTPADKLIVSVVARARFLRAASHAFEARELKRRRSCRITPPNAYVFRKAHLRDRCKLNVIVSRLTQLRVSAGPKTFHVKHSTGKAQLTTAFFENWASIPLRFMRAVAQSS